MGGSSPLTRGKRTLSDLDRLAAGLIPAHAGKTVRARSAARTAGAHPRSRGENKLINGVTHRWAGSSPLTRGKQREEMGRAPDRGLIPAHAGKTIGRIG